ncbi:hypothetical protein EXS70_03790 [Candidatus Peribacteria bacterium]|nr:hypothetical protein [Candidatus Peribacteria bacterium]
MSITIADFSDTEVVAVVEQLRCTTGPSEALDLLAAISQVKGGVSFQDPTKLQEFDRELRTRYDQILQESSFHE